jgi:uncharacterized membrane protein YphA (DoxX/SURF4 family)
MMMRVFTNKYLLFAFRIIVAFVFILAGAEKVSNPEAFSDSIYNYRLLPLIFINVLAIILPWIELTVGILLLLGILVKENSYIISIMYIVFIFAIGISLARGLNIDCGCFGTSLGTQIGLLKIGENLVLLVMSFLLLKFGSGILSLQINSQPVEV